jgi:hypothetical protein
MYAEMAGGDLDGDEYLILWEPTLIPAQMHEPATYGAYSPPQEPVRVFASSTAFLGVPADIMNNIRAFFVKYLLVLDRIGQLDRLYFGMLG